MNLPQFSSLWLGLWADHRLQIEVARIFHLINPDLQLKSHFRIGITNIQRRYMLKKLSLRDESWPKFWQSVFSLRKQSVISLCQIPPRLITFYITCTFTGCDISTTFLYYLISLMYYPNVKYCMNGWQCAPMLFPPIYPNGTIWEIRQIVALPFHFDTMQVSSIWNL